MSPISWKERDNFTYWWGFTIGFSVASVLFGLAFIAGNLFSV